MKKLIILSLAVILTTSCTVYIPHETETIVPESYRLNLVLNIYPEDAKVIANGRFIGEAYEFSTEKTALRINKPDTDIVLKKRGFREEKLNIRKYNSGTARVSLDLQPERDREQPEPPVSSKPAEANKLPLPPVKTKATQSVKITEETEKTEKAPEIFIYTIKITPASSAIYIDGKFWGTSPAEGVVINNLRMTAGEHKIDVYKPGYRNYTKRFTASSGSNKKLTITLLKSK